MNHLIESEGRVRVASERGGMTKAGKAPGLSRQTTGVSKCPECGASYAKKRKHQTFCSPKCRKAFWKKDRTVHSAYDIRASLADIKASLARIEAKMGTKP